MPSSHKAISTGALRFLRSLLHGHPPRPCPLPQTVLVATQQRSHPPALSPADRRQPDSAGSRPGPPPIVLLARRRRRPRRGPARRPGPRPGPGPVRPLPAGAAAGRAAARALRRRRARAPARVPRPAAARASGHRRAAAAAAAAAEESGDGAAGAGVPAAGALAARINDAYATLSDPLRRARHILRARGALGDEGGDDDGDCRTGSCWRRSWRRARRPSTSPATRRRRRRCCGAGTAARMEDVVRAVGGGVCEGRFGGGEGAVRTVEVLAGRGGGLAAWGSYALDDGLHFYVGYFSSPNPLGANVGDVEDILVVLGVVPHCRESRRNARSMINPPTTIAPSMSLLRPPR